MARPAAGRQLRLGPGPALRLPLLLGVLLLRSGAAAAAEPCQAPRQWEGRTVFYEHGSGRNTRASVSYDGLNQRLRVLEERKALIPCKKYRDQANWPIITRILLPTLFINGCHTGLLPVIWNLTSEPGLLAFNSIITSFNTYGIKSLPNIKGYPSTFSPFPISSEELVAIQYSAPTMFFEYILLYKDAVMFQIEQVTKLCSKISLTEPWDPYDIPANSTYEDQYSIGGPGDEVTVQEWSDRKPARKLESWVGIYTVKDCYPVQETYTKNYSVTTSTRFFDIHPGIADPSIFTPPSTCQTAQMMRMKDEC
ncbi:ependymin related 1 [Turdus rufiventris]|nr:ependymin related 1 [Turdus rufiventris]